MTCLLNQLLCKTQHPFLMLVNNLFIQCHQRFLKDDGNSNLLVSFLLDVLAFVFPSWTVNVHELLLLS